MARRVVYIVNPAAAAGRGEVAWRELEPRLLQFGLGGQTRMTRGPDHALALTAESLDAGADLVVAVGGDGTAREVAEAAIAAGGGVPVGLVPLGTGNDFARQIGVGTVGRAIAALREGSNRRVDAIEVACQETGRVRVHHALVFAALGFAGELLRWTTPRVKRWFGPRLCYSVGFVRALVRTDGREYAGRWLHLGAGNTEWAGGGALRLSPGARYDDGQFDVLLVDAMSRLAAAYNFPRLVRGTFTADRRVRYFRGEWLTIETERPEPLQLDGDGVGRTPATLRLRPGCLTVRVPLGNNEPVGTE
jgi:YegS/Rv2252/BmrU family lipid kinase